MIEFYFTYILYTILEKNQRVDEKCTIFFTFPDFSVPRVGF